MMIDPSRQKWDEETENIIAPIIFFICVCCLVAFGLGFVTGQAMV